MADYISKYEGQEIDDLLDLVPEKYTKPQTGISSTDMSAAVQTSLSKADTALQEDALDDYRTSDDQDVIDAGKADKVQNATSGNFAGLDENGNLTDSGKKASNFATAAQGAKADTALQPAALDDYRTADDQDDIDDALDARIDALSSLGRFLSVWDCTTGLPQTQPTSLPYTYKSGDYYIVGKVGATNYKPSGSTYSGAASQVVETGTPKVNDIYKYDGSIWSLLVLDNPQAIWGGITGTLSNQTDLQNALNAKQATLVSGTNIKTLNNQSLLGGGNIEVSGAAFLITLTESEGTYTADKTYTEIKAAFDAHRPMMVKDEDGFVCPMTDGGYNNNTLQISYGAVAVGVGSSFGFTYEYFGREDNESWLFQPGVAPLVINLTESEGVITADVDDDTIRSAIQFGTPMHVTITGDYKGFIPLFMTDTDYALFQIISSGAVITVEYQYTQGAGVWTKAEESFITSDITSSSTNNEAAGAKAVYDALVAGKQVFIATYGITPYADLIDAVNAGKLVICDYSNVKAVLCYVDTSSNPNRLLFSTSISPYFYLIRVTNNNQWTVSSYQYEYLTNKVTSLKSQSTDIQYPSAKCVYDALLEKAEKTTSQALTFTAGGANPYALDAGKIYTLDASTATGAEGESITFSLPASPSVTDIFDVQITIGATAPTINWPSGISWAGGSAPTIAASKKYEVNICNNLAVAQEF